jgi:hypothetical protein
VFVGGNYAAVEVTTQDEVPDHYGQVALLVRSLLETQSPLKADRPESFDADVATVFESKVVSYRELVFTITVARMLDPSYQATVSAYACNPRTLAEKSIQPEFRRLKIPCGQSPFLNIAKATSAIDQTWLSQRRPANVAEATLRLVSAIDSANETELQHLAQLFAAKFRRLAQAVREAEFTGNPALTLESISELLNGLIQNAPDGGNTAQRIVGILLESLYQHQGLRVEGIQDSAFQTNATSKKPGDLSVVTATEEILLVVEVTTKMFNEQRIAECSQSLDLYVAETATKIDSVLVLCEEKDCPKRITGTRSASDGFFGRLRDSAYEYEFVDIHAWINTTVASMTPIHRELMMKRILEYVNHFQTAASVKEEFARLAKK